MTVGEKIKKYRTEKELSQKQLAIMSDMSEPAVRNYELGNRQPSEKQLQKIANALGISLFALSNPNLDTYDGVMHALFYLEDNFGLIPYKEDYLNKLRFDFADNSGRGIDGIVGIWAERKQQLKAGEISQEYYNEWKSSYPRLYAQECKQKIKELKKKNEKI
jgi:transcriptional regulator with XRE-family HTH domain